jgi:hypothetical protein
MSFIEASFGRIERITNSINTCDRGKIMLKIIETETGAKVHLSGYDDITFAVILFLLDEDRHALSTGNRKLRALAIDRFLDDEPGVSEILCSELVGLWRYRAGRKGPIFPNDPTVPISTDAKTTRARRRLIWKFIHQSVPAPCSADAVVAAAG